MRAYRAAPLLFALTLHAQTGKTMHATGPMDVSTKPDTAFTASYGRMVLTKGYHGGLEGTATGEMLFGGDVKGGAAGYVAIETVTGTLDGRAGTFQLMQLGTMQDGKRDLHIIVVPGSGTAALKGMAGTLTIDIAPGGAHSYTLDYTLPQS